MIVYTLTGIAVLILFSAFFSGSEMAYLSADRLRIELVKSRGGLVAGILKRLYRRPDRFVTSMLVGNNVVLVLYGILMARLLDPVWARMGLTAGLLPVLFNSLVSTFIIVILGEYLPKVTFRRSANKSVYRAAAPLLLLYVLLYPFTLICTGISNLFIWMLDPKQRHRAPATKLTTIDLDNFLSANSGGGSSEGGNLDTEMKIMRNALDFSKIQARNCMIPRNEIVGCSVETPLEELKKTFVESGLSKIVIYRENIDNVVGYIHSAEVFKGDPWQSHLKKAVFAPESMYGSKLMQQLMQSQTSMAIVIDELGGTSGLITLEDLVEEIFGDIKDEHDTNAIVAKKQDDFNYILSGRLEIDDANEQLGLSLPESDEYMTVAGFILSTRPHIPDPGEVVVIGNYSFKILRSTESKIELVKLTITPE